MPVKSTDVNDHGTPDMFAGGKFTTKDGRANLMAHDWEAPSELPDDEYPLILCTVREVGHYSCRSMTGNCKTLALLADEPGFVRMNPADARRVASRTATSSRSTAAAARYTAAPT